MDTPLARDVLITKAEDAFIRLSQQLDILLDLTNFYLDRYPAIDASTRYKYGELKTTIGNIVYTIQQLGDILQGWKLAEPRVLTVESTEQDILNEMWANVQVLVQFLRDHEIDMEPFNEWRTVTSFKVLVMCNRLV